MTREQVLTAHAAQGITTIMNIYKIFRRAEWDTLRTAGETQGAPIDLTDGYIHFSTAQQVEGTAAKHFAGEVDLMLVAVETDRLGTDLKWEVSRGDQLFPHLYRILKMDDVVWAQPIEQSDGVHQFPAGLLEASG